MRIFHTLSGRIFLKWLVSIGLFRDRSTLSPNICQNQTPISVSFLGNSSKTSTLILDISKVNKNLLKLSFFFFINKIWGIIVEVEHKKKPFFVQRGQGDGKVIKKVEMHYRTHFNFIISLKALSQLELILRSCLEHISQAWVLWFASLAFCCEVLAKSHFFTILF